MAKTGEIIAYLEESTRSGGWRQTVAAAQDNAGSAGMRNRVTELQREGKRTTSSDACAALSVKTRKGDCNKSLCKHRHQKQRKRASELYSREQAFTGKEYHKIKRRTPYHTSPHRSQGKKETERKTWIITKRGSLQRKNGDHKKGSYK